MNFARAILARFRRARTAHPAQEDYDLRLQRIGAREAHRVVRAGVFRYSQSLREV